MKRHFPALRGIAILLVIVNHTIHMSLTYSGRAGYPPLAQDWAYTLLDILSNLGYFAVPLFMFMSGTFFAYAAQGGRLTYRTVLANLSHLLWPYLLWSVLFYVLLAVSPSYNQTFTPLEYARHILTGYPFHFVPLIFFFYLISPVLVWLVDKLGWAPVLAVIGLAQAILINIIDVGTFGFYFPEWMQVLIPPVIGRTFADWGIYFPLGLIYAQNMRAMTPFIERFGRIFLLATIGFFALAIVSDLTELTTPWARHVFPLTLIFYIPLIQRNQIPRPKWFEDIGKKSYGLYLTHLMTLDITLTLIQALAPGLLAYPVVLMPFLYVIALSVPLGMMALANRFARRDLVRYAFG